MKKIALALSLIALTLPPVFIHAQKNYISVACSCGDCSGDHGDHGSDDRGNR